MGFMATIKAQQAMRAFDGEYILLGPDTKHNTEFTETDELLTGG